MINKNKLFLLVLLLMLLHIACKTDQTVGYKVYSGETMGTYYRITYSEDKPLLQSSIDSIFKILNDEMSTYIESSFISRFNSSEKGLKQIPSHFKTVFEQAKITHQVADGAFDPTLMPIINYWGFGYTSKKAVEAIDSSMVESLMEDVGFDKVVLIKNELIKNSPKVELDFSAIAKGYAVDVLAIFLQEHGIKNFLVDIGGESYASGLNSQSKKWTLGINTPSEDAAFNDFILKLTINNQGLATSGNYRNYYDVDGLKYGHTIDAKTGYPYTSKLLSASIIAKTCMEADAMATACMASGLERSLRMINEMNDTEGCLIFGTEDGKMDYIFTDGFKDYILE